MPLPFRPRCSRVVQLDAVAVGEIAEELAALEGVLALLPGLVAASRCRLHEGDAIAWLGRALAGIDIDVDRETDDDQPDANACVADVEQATAALSAIARHRLSRVRRLLEALEPMELMEA